MDTISKAAPLNDITHWAPQGACARLQMLRLDQIHPVVSGNKWFKLRCNIQRAGAEAKTTLLTFGGGYSNHLVATACAAQQAGLRSIGVVRGIYEGAQMTPTLRSCVSYGMQLLPYSKAAYAGARANADRLREQFPDAFIIPEGGANEPGIRGAAGIAALIPEEATDVCVAVGTGATLAGLHRALPDGVGLYGFCAARNCGDAAALIDNEAIDRPVQLLPVPDPRFGKWTAGLLDFVNAFYLDTGIPLDVVYTAKMMMAVQSRLRERFFDPGGRIVCIHTGGLQGNPPGLFA
jgi:1-aminocyclopropane-1-carboxylate deaminase